MTAVGVELVHGMSGYCAACGAVIFAWRPRLVIGGRQYCAPIGSACHESGLISSQWVFTPADAAELLAADIDWLRGRGVRSVDPHVDALLGESAEHVAA